MHLNWTNFLGILSTTFIVYENITHQGTLLDDATSIGCCIYLTERERGSW